MKYCNMFRHEGITFGTERDNMDNPRCFALCIYCTKFKKQYPTANNFEQVFRAHTTGKEHKKEKGQARIPQFFLSTMLYLKIDDFENTFLAGLCYGYRPPELEEGSDKWDIILNTAARELPFCLPNNRLYPFTIERRKVTLVFAKGSKFADRCPIVFDSWLRSKDCAQTIQPGASDRRPIIGWCCLACQRRC